MATDEQHLYDLIIVGGSAVATAAGVYAARRQLDFLILTKDFGGEVATSGEIGNWPGITETTGTELAKDFKKHLDHYDAPSQSGITVNAITKQDDGTFCISARKGKETGSAKDKTEPDTSGATCDYRAKTVIVGTGVHPRRLEVDGEPELRNKGVSYCTTCDGPLFSGKTVAVIGGGNSALEAALMLKEIAKYVYVVNINGEFNGENAMIEKVKEAENVEPIYNATTTAISGEKMVSGLTYKDESGEAHTLEVEGVFIHIGMIPNSGMVPDEVEKNDYGEIAINTKGETNVPGLFAAGDVTDVPYKQIVIAAGQGCAALLSAVNYINKSKS